MQVIKLKLNENSSSVEGYNSYLGKKIFLDRIIKTVEPQLHSLKLNPPRYKMFTDVSVEQIFLGKEKTLTEILQFLTENNVNFDKVITSKFSYHLASQMLIVDEAFCKAYSDDDYNSRCREYDFSILSHQIDIEVTKEKQRALMSTKNDLLQQTCDDIKDFVIKHNGLECSVDVMYDKANNIMFNVWIASPVQEIYLPTTNWGKVRIKTLKSKK